jgi:hypothetical protein
VSAYYGGTAGFVTLALGMTVAPFAYLVGAARRVMLMGFGHEDLAPAFKGEIEQAREELTLEHRPGGSVLDRALPGLAKVGGVVFVVSTLGVILAINGVGPVAFGEIVGPLFGMSGGAAMLATIAVLARLQRSRDVDTEFWAKVWKGKIGRLVFSVAKKLLGNRQRASAVTHRATELTLGMAAEQLFESLPKQSQQALGDLPALLGRLQRDAQLLRKRYDELQEVLSDIGDASASEAYADLRGARDTVHAKLADAVGALETIRLNLLRLHAGSATVAGLTTHLGIAADVSREVERLIAAQDEVEKAMKFPRTPSATPV